jgi:cobalt-zinc-cadmium efflux system membrane fusion protein
MILMNKTLVAIVSLALLGGGLPTACSRPQEKKDRAEAAAATGVLQEATDQTRSHGMTARDRRTRRLRGDGSAGGSGQGRRQGGGAVLKLTEEEKGAFEIKTVTASSRPMRAQLRAMGKVLAPQTRKAIVSYAFPARIAELHVKVGDWVKAGQKLVTLQSEEVGKARAEYFKTQADFELARTNLDRGRTLFDRGVGARKNLVTAEAEFKVAEANLDAAEKKLHVLGFSEAQVDELNRSHQINPIISLYAPIRGKIIAFSAVLGAMVDQNTEILTIMDPRVLWIDAEIYEKDIARIQLGQEVKVSVPAYPAESFLGKVIYIGDVLKEETRTITVRTEVPNRDAKLKPGMFAEMTIYLNHQDKVLAVPEEAVLDDRDDKIVFVRVDDGYQLRVVRIGMKDAGFREIVDGLETGEEVVTVGSYQLKSKLYDEILKQAGVH